MMDQESLRAQLSAERAELGLRLNTPVETARGDEGDLATQAQNKERLLWLANDARMRLAGIEKALERLEQGTYGLCARCHNPIPDERLSIMPLTLHCIECQSQLERTHKRP